MAASGPQRNRNVNKRTHCIVVCQDSLKHYYWLVGQKYNTHVTLKDQIHE
jgi:hypothetical protein